MITADQLKPGSHVIDCDGKIFQILETEKNIEIFGNESHMKEGARVDVCQSGGGFVKQRLVSEILEYGRAVDEGIAEYTQTHRYARAGSEWFNGQTVRVVINGSNNGHYTWNGWAMPSMTAEDLIAFMKMQAEHMPETAKYTYIEGKECCHMLRLSEEGNPTETYTFNGETLFTTWNDGVDNGGHVDHGVDVYIGNHDKSVRVWEAPGSGSWTWDTDEPGRHCSAVIDSMEQGCQLIEWDDDAKHALVVRDIDYDREGAEAPAHTILAENVLLG